MRTLPMSPYTRSQNDAPTSATGTPASDTCHSTTCARTTAATL